MKSDNYKITQYSVSSILNYVENSQIAIPEIQRPFVWKGEEVRALIDSLYEGYPIGYLIVWQNSQVRVRGFGKGGTKKILIDGQQRVTALMAALLGKEVLDEQYQSCRIRIAFNPLAQTGDERFAVCDEKHEQDSKWIPDISIFFRRDFSFRQFEKEYKEANSGEDFTPLEESVDTLKEIVKHQVGVIELSFLLDIDVVSEIFIRINLQGKPLNQEDFVMSKISVNEEYGGDYISNCIDYFCHLLLSLIHISKSKEESSADSRKRVSKAWEIQKERFAQSTTLFNGRMNKNEVEIYCKLDEEGQQLMKEAFSVFQLTGRSYFKILKVARTIADLEGSYDIKSRHVEEALYFRQKGEGRVKVR